MTDNAVQPPTPPGNASPPPALVAVIARIWAEALGVSESELDPLTSDFFELGGYSLLAMQVISRILEHFQSELPEDTFEIESTLLYAVFDQPTIRSLAASLEENHPSIRSVAT